MMNRHLCLLPGALGLLGLLAGCGDPSAAPAVITPTAVATTAVELDAGYVQTAAYTGRVEPRMDSELGFELGGLLASVGVEEGAAVERGAVLARLDTARLNARREESLAGLQQVRADLELARSTLERVREAHAYKGVSRQRLDEAEQAVNRLEAAERVAAASLNRIEVDLGKARLRAPFDGVVVERLADPGQVLAPGMPTLRLQSTGAAVVRVGIAPAALDGLVTGRRYELEIGGKRYDAVLDSVVPRRDETARTIDVRFSLDAAVAHVRPGDLARLEIETFVDEPGLWVPLDALAEGARGLWTVLVAERADDTTFLLERRTLEILHATNGEAFVRGALHEGDLLVASGVHRLVAGQRVVLTDDDRARLARRGRGAPQ